MNIADEKAAEAAAKDRLDQFKANEVTLRLNGAAILAATQEDLKDPVWQGRLVLSFLNTAQGQLQLLTMQNARIIELLEQGAARVAAQG